MQLATLPAAALPNAKAPSAPADQSALRARIDKTAKEFEASFLSVMVGQMFSGVETSAPFGGGQGEAMYKSFLSDSLAHTMADRGGIGVSRAVKAELLKLQGLQP